jgi:dethiobiotin synthetase
MAVCVKVNGKWNWSTDNTHLHTPNKFSSPTSPQCAYSFEELEIPVMKINTGNQQHKKNERLLLTIYKHILE